MDRRVVKGGAAAAVATVVAVLVALAGGGSASPAHAAAAAGLSNRPDVGLRVHPTHFTGDLRRIPRGNVIQREEKPEPQSPNETPPAAQGGDPAAQTAPASVPAPAPSNAFAGLDFANWGAGWPPDTNGDVGPAYFVQAVNTSVGFFRKSDGARQAAFTFNQLFSQAPTGTPCDSNNQGDPVALYDPIGDRYIVSDFAWSNYTSGAMYQCMAVSASSDPINGGWYFYAWQTESGGKLPDYPKLGVWPDGIYMSANIFATTGSGSFQNVEVWAFDRVAMEAGGAASGVAFNVPTNVGGVTVFSLLPSNARVVTGLPPSGSPNYFASIWGAYAIRTWKFHVDWATPGNSTFTGPTNSTISTFNVGPSNVPEKSGNNLDTLSYRLMMQNQYTNQGGTESLWLTHTVGNGGSPNVAQVRWYQLPVTGGTIAAAPRQQSTWGPDAKNRFMSSLAVDKNGDMAVGYSVSDSTMYPAIRYAGRLAGDPLSTLTQSEASLIEGTGYQCCNFSSGGTNTRWGDYSAMSIDPDGCTFWYTNEYYDVLPVTLSQDNWKTEIGSFKFGSCTTTTATPSISGFTPTSGPIGTTVTISGSALTGASSVMFNGTSDATFAVNNDSTITAHVPSGATNGTISVTTPGGTATSAGSFTVTSSPSPTISSFSPASGAIGTSVSISGTNFTGASSVTFNGTPDASFVVNNAGSITAHVPSGAGSGQIAVTTPGGTATSASSFIVTVGPTISSVSPTSGKVGTTVTISGAHLTGATVKFSGVTAAPPTTNTDSQIVTKVPVGTPMGNGTLTVTAAAGTATTSFRVSKK